MNEHRSCVPLHVHRLLLGIFLFLEGFQADFLDHGVCTKCLCDGIDRSVVCKGLQFEEISPLPYDTRYLSIDGSCREEWERGFEGAAFSYNFRAVSITNSCLDSFIAKDLGNLVNLVKLDLSGNRLASFDKFPSPNNLKELVLDGNKFVNFSQSVLETLSNLERLSVRDNLVHNVKAFTENFRYLPKLSRLDLSGNPLGAISFGDFDSLPPSLRTFRLSDCQLVDIHDDTFSNLSSHLLDLDLSGNHLSLNQLKGLFFGFKTGSALKVLRLSRLDIEEIPPDPLWGRMPDLEVLDFSSNRIEGISYLAFEGLHLKELHMDYNKIANLDGVKNATSFQHLTVWSLSNNNLATIPVLQLPQLSRLSLGYNKISRLIPSHFSSMPSLQWINMTKNRISHIVPSTFTGLKVKSLDVSGNNIQKWDWLSGLEGVENLNVSGNNLTYLSAEVFKSTGKALVSLDVSVCGIRQIAHDSFLTSPALRDLRLGGNHFGQQIENGSLIHLFRDLQDLISLDLSNMRLATIPVEQFTNLTSLRRLFLSDNKINQLCDTASRDIGNSLHVLEVRRNCLKEIDTDYLKHLPSLKKVNFAHNPFHCSCAVDSLRQWMNESRIEVVDFHGQGYSCSSPESAKGVLLKSYEPEDCKVTNSTFNLTIAFSVGATLVFFVIVLIVLYSFKRCAFFTKPRYAYMGGGEFEWNGQRKVFYVFYWCRKLRDWCPKRECRRKSKTSTHPHSQPLTERSVC